VLSVGSVGSTLAIGSIGSFGSILSVGSAFSAGSALSWQSRWSLLSSRSFGAAMSAHAGSRQLTGPPAALAGIGVVAYLGYLLERRRRTHRKPYPKLRLVNAT
jgi:hypothetical protein